MERLRSLRRPLRARLYYQPRLFPEAPAWREWPKICRWLPVRRKKRRRAARHLTLAQKRPVHATSNMRRLRRPARLWLSSSLRVCSCYLCEPGWKHSVAWMPSVVQYILRARRITLQSARTLRLSKRGALVLPSALRNPRQPSPAANLAEEDSQNALRRYRRRRLYRVEYGG